MKRPPEVEAFNFWLPQYLVPIGRQCAQPAVTVCCAPWSTKEGWGLSLSSLPDRSRQRGPLQWAHPFENVVKSVGVRDSRVKVIAMFHHKGRSALPVLTWLVQVAWEWCLFWFAAWVEQNTVLLSRRRCLLTMTHFSCMSAGTSVWFFIHSWQTRVLEPFYSALFSAGPWWGQASTRNAVDLEMWQWLESNSNVTEHLLYLQPGSGGLGLWEPMEHVQVAKPTKPCVHSIYFS